MDKIKRSELQKIIKEEITSLKKQNLKEYHFSSKEDLVRDLDIAFEELLNISKEFNGKKFSKIENYVEKYSRSAIGLYEMIDKLIGILDRIDKKN